MDDIQSENAPVANLKGDDTIKYEFHKLYAFGKLIKESARSESQRHDTSKGYNSSSVV